MFNRQETMAKAGLPLFAAALVSLFLATACNMTTSPKNSDASSPVFLTFTTPSDTTGRLYPVKPTNNAGIIIVSTTENSSERWDSVCRKAQENRLTTAIVSLPSALTSGSTKTLVPELSRKELETIDAARRALVERGVQLENIAIIGEEKTAVHVLQYALQRPEVPAIVLLSPVTTEQGIDLSQTIVEYGNRACLIMAAEGDAYAAAVAHAIKKNAVGFCELRIYTGAAHGADLFYTSQQALEQLFLWLSQVLHFAVQ